ncbi:MAG: hypothetical protein V9G19_00870 [Tetrasphaera sp.]
MTHHTAARLIAIAAAAGVATGSSVGLPAAAAPTSSAPTVCHYTWGSLAKTDRTSTTGPVENLRSGRHTCFDRIVVDLTGRAPGYRVEYVAAIVQDGSGAVLPVRGGAKLKITVNAPAYDAGGNLHYQPTNPAEALNVTGYQTLRQVRWLGSFEGTSGIGVGVRARLPMRVTKLTDGTTSRLVVDVAHNW